LSLELVLDTLEPPLETLESLLSTLEQSLDTSELLLDTLERALDTSESLLETLEQLLETLAGVIKSKVINQVYLFFLFHILFTFQGFWVQMYHPCLSLPDELF